MLKLRLLLIACCLLALTTACAPPVQQARERFFWPPPPQEPKVEFIGVYTGEELQPDSFIDGFTGKPKRRLVQPAAIAIDSQGKAYVSLSKTNTIAIMDFAGKSLKGYNWEFKMPFGLAIDSKDNLYVVDRKAKEISVYNPTQELLFTFGKEKFEDPLRIALDEERDRIYVSDAKLHVVQVFTLKGEYLRSIGRPGRAIMADDEIPPEIKESAVDNEGEFFRPNGVAIDREGNIYVADQINARIQVFDPAGNFLRTFGERGTEDRALVFGSPAGLAFDSENHLWVTDMMKTSLMTLTLQPEPELLFATFGAGNSELSAFNFTAPLDISIDRFNRVYVVDSIRHRISIWQYLDQAYLEKNPLPVNWMERKDITDIWYLDSGLTPDGKMIVPDGKTIVPKQ